MAPLTDRTIGVRGALTRQRDDLAHLLGRELRWGAGLRRICQAFRDADLLKRYVLELQSASPPVAWRLIVNAQFPSNLQIIQAVARGQHDTRSQPQLLAGRKKHAPGAPTLHVPSQSVLPSAVSA